MAKIAVIIDDQFEDSEYVRPARAFKDAGHEIVHVGLEAGRTVRGKKDATPVTIDRAADDATGDDFDALLIPGGYSPDKLRAHDAPVAFVRNFMNQGKPVFSICHGPQLLITAQVVYGRTMTGYRSIRQDLVNAGVTFLDREVVEDDNLVSSRHPGDLDAFIEASLKRLKA